VTKNTQAFQIGQQEELPSDPLTGGGRYIPQHHQTSSSRPDVQMTSEFIPAVFQFCGEMVCYYHFKLDWGENIYNTKRWRNVKQIHGI